MLSRPHKGLEPPADAGRCFPLTVAIPSLPKWAIYRWLQVNLLMGVDLLYRYKMTLKGVMTEKLATALENDILDSHYVIVGALEGALATADRNVRRLSRLIRPAGELIPDSHPSEEH